MRMIMKMRRNIGERKLIITNKKYKIIFRKLFLSSTESTIYFYILLIFFCGDTHFAHRGILNNSPFSILFSIFSRMLHSKISLFSIYISLSLIFIISFNIYHRLRFNEFSWVSLPTSTPISLAPASPMPLPLLII